MTREFHRLRDLIHERTGLFFPDGRIFESLEARLSALLEKSGCASASEYYRLLEERPDSPHWLNLIAALSKPVSSFLRASAQMKVLVNILVPRLLVKNDAGPIKIWSAGCATGEEPLTMAMALADAGWFDRAGIEIYASDASFTAIEKARAGVFQEHRVRYLAPDLRDKYFIPEGEAWRVKSGLHARIRWSLVNLINEAEMAELAASHIIFCRNVFIYFSDFSIERTLRLFGKYMPIGGYLFTDEGNHFTSLITGIEIFEEEKVEGRSIWRKRKLRT
jgi:chemotaxis protein methyltransferase CheR